LKRTLALSLMLLLIPLVTVGCGNPSSTAEPSTVEPQGNAVLGYVADTYNAGFDFGLFQQVVSENYDANVVLSPFSAKLALAMAYNGADGETREAMARTLEFEGLYLDEVNGQLRELLHSLEEANQEARLQIANSLWADEQVDFYEDFILRCRENYDAEVANLDLQDPQAVEAINSWVKENTGEKIEKILDKLGSNDDLVLANALYFNGKWTLSFDESLTEDRDFHLLDGGIKKVPMMNQSGEFSYYEDRDLQAIDLPYGEGRLSMYVFLPKEDVGYQDFLRSLNLRNWTGWMEGFSSREGQIVLPRFKVEYEKRLDDALKAMGMEPAYEGGFAGMGVYGEEFQLSRVQHKTYIDVNEEGTEAAAVTSVEVSRCMAMDTPPFTMIVDRPFFFAIRDNQTGTLLFLGSVANP